MGGKRTCRRPRRLAASQYAAPVNPYATPKALPQSAPHPRSTQTDAMPQISAQLARQIASSIAAEIGAQTAQAQAAIALLDEGATVPFIARYRKEVTGGLDDTQLRNLETRLGELRAWLHEVGVIRSRVAEGKETEGAKYRDYFDHRESLARIPSHRLLALFRARREEILFIDLDPGPDADAGHLLAEGRVAHHVGVKAQGRPADKWLQDTCRLTWKAKLHLHLLLDLFSQAREKAEAEAIQVFGDNLKDLLLAAPAGPKAVLGLDPGLRTGVKVAVVDRTGKVVETATIYPHEPRRQWDQSLAVLHALCAKHGVELIAIGNGTASRETDTLAGELIQRTPVPGLQKLVVSEAGASVYSASELAAREFPNLDVSLRGAVSIARRLQDPLAELVKIEPKSIG